MTVASVLSWIAFAVLLMAIGARGGLLLTLSRAIDHARAAECCLRMCWRAAECEWRRQYPECLRWAQKER